MGYVGSAIFYLTCYTIAALLIHASARSQTSGPVRAFLVVASVGIPVGVSTFRGRVGTDYDNLVWSMIGMNDLEWTHYSIEYVTERLSRLEVAYRFCLYVSNQQSMAAPYVLYCASSAVAVVAFLLACREMRIAHIGPVYFAYLCVVFSVSICNPGQGAAVSLVLLAISEAARRRWFRYLLAVGLAVAFHVSGVIAIVALPFLWLDSAASRRPTKSLPGWTILSFVIAAIAVSVFAVVVDAVPGLVEYAEYVSSPEVRLANGVFAFAAAFVMMIPAVRGVQTKNIPPLTVLAILSAAMGIAFSFPLLAHAVRRTAFYFFPIATVLPLNSLGVEAKRLFPKRMVCVFAIAYFVVVYVVFYQTYRIVPYSFMEGI